MQDPLLTLIVVIVVAGTLFFVLRSVVLWYYKIDRIVELMERQDKSLQQIASLLSGEQIQKAKEKSENPK